MTLLQCVACGDVLRLIGYERRCQCLRSRGTDADGEIEIHGPVRVLVLSDDAGDGVAATPSGRWHALSTAEANIRRIPVPPLL